MKTLTSATTFPSPEVVTGDDTAPKVIAVEVKLRAGAATHSRSVDQSAEALSREQVRGQRLALGVQRTKSRDFSALNFLNRTYPHPPDLPYPLPTSTQGKGAWPATDAAARGDRAGSSVGGGFACVGTSSNLTSLEPVGPGTQKRRGVRAGLAAGPQKRGRSGIPMLRDPSVGGDRGRASTAPPPRGCRITMARSVWLRRNG